MQSITLNPYIFFKGNCKEAMEHYQHIFGGELIIQTHGEAGPENAQAPADYIMHAQLSGGHVTLMASDTLQASEKAAKISLSLTCINEAQMRIIFDQLSENVAVTYPIKEEFWGDLFGSVTDQFGIEWMVNCPAGTAE